MRVEKTKRRRAMRAGTAMLAVSIFCLFALERFDRRMGSPKLVSIEESPDIGEMCVWEPASLNAAATTGGRSRASPIGRSHLQKTICLEASEDLQRPQR